MEAKVSGEKAFHTALIITPPKELYPPIQAIREKYDSAFERWMPHINMSFPFLPPNEFDVGHQLLEEELKDFPQFEIKFENFNNFDHGKKSVLWLQPITQGTEILDLEKRILKVFPFLNDLS